MATDTAITALVTGGNRGIGRAVVQALAARGDWRVLMGCRNPGAVDSTGLPENVTPVALEVGDLERLDTDLEAALKAAGPIDVLVNNAGILDMDGCFGLTAQRLQAHLDVHLLGPFRLAQQLVPGMVRRGYGRVVNVSSGWGSFDSGLQGPPAYAVAKAALNALTVKLAAEVPPAAVKINAADPGWVRTRMGGPEAPDRPETAADGIAWLATLPDDGPTGGFFHNRRPVAW